MKDPLQVDDDESQNSNPNPQRNRFLVSELLRAVKNVFQAQRPGKLPNEETSGSNNDLSGCSSTLEGAGQDPCHNFLILCIPFMRWGIKAHQPDVCRVRSDREFFRLLRAIHSEHNVSHRWKGLRRVSSMTLSRYLHNTVELGRRKLIELRSSRYFAMSSSISAHRLQCQEPKLRPSMSMNHPTLILRLERTCSFTSLRTLITPTYCPYYSGGSRRRSCADFRPVPKRAILLVGESSSSSHSTDTQSSFAAVLGLHCVSWRRSSGRSLKMTFKEVLLLGHLC